jgi:hypothetical protein
MRFHLCGESIMTDEAKLARYALLMSASIARDLEGAGLLSDATRKAIHNGLAEIRASAGGADAEEELMAAFRILDGIAPAADG